MATAMVLEVDIFGDVRRGPLRLSPLLKLKPIPGCTMVLATMVVTNHHSGQDHSTARDRLQLQQRAQPQRTSSYVPKDIYLQDHSRSHSDQVRIRSVRVHR